MDAIIAEEVVKNYGGERVLAGLSIRVKVGESIGIVGPNGCGKTTFLKILAGLMEPDMGRVVVRGSRAIVFQDNLLLPWMNVKDNISLGLKLKGYPPNLIEERVKAVSTLLGIEEYLEKYPSKISGGTARKAAIARALVLKPDILLLDEPYTGLDEKSIRSLKEALNRLRGKVTMVIVSHQLDELKENIDRVYVLSHKPTRVLRSLYSQDLKIA